MAKFQSTRPVWGETVYGPKTEAAMDISIHSPRVGRDDCVNRWISARELFQSTRPVWGETRTAGIPTQSNYFNPLAPCGARRDAEKRTADAVEFQSTRPVWGETTAYF